MSQWRRTTVKRDAACASAALARPESQLGILDLRSVHPRFPRNLLRVELQERYPRSPPRAAPRPRPLRPRNAPLARLLPPQPHDPPQQNVHPTSPPLLCHRVSRPARRPRKHPHLSLREALPLGLVERRDDQTRPLSRMSKHLSPHPLPERGRGRVLQRCRRVKEMSWSRTTRNTELLLGSRTLIQHEGRVGPCKPR